MWEFFRFVKWLILHKHTEVISQNSVIQCINVQKTQVLNKLIFFCLNFLTFSQIMEQVKHFLSDTSRMLMRKVDYNKINRIKINYCHQLLLSGETQYQSNLSSYLVSSWSKSLSISGGDSSCSWVLVCVLGLIVKEEFKSVMLGGGWRCGELLVSSSTFAVIQRIRKSVPPQKHPHWKNTNTQLQYSLYCYSLDWWW